jgi:hypothetical protein
MRSKAYEGWAGVVTNEPARELQPRRTDPLDAQYADLMATVWACERAAQREDRLDAVIRYSQYNT